MTSAYVLLTALPPTKGHLHLIQFASHVAEDAHVILCTQEGEPFAFQRYSALVTATQDIPGVQIHHLHQNLPQEPADSEDFWPMWKRILTVYGITEADFIVASETYGQTLAEVAGAHWIPYDIDREIYASKATSIRSHPRTHFDTILPEFQSHLRARVTLFGAESVGKTTLSLDLADTVVGHWLPEWARPYMEKFEPEVTEPVMNSIWRGQKALQLQGQDLIDKPFIIQDTDLFSTWGYWKLWEDKLGSAPEQLLEDALADQSDLYIIPRSNIPFDPDPLRFGGDVRESPDQYWVDICEQYKLPYVLLNGVYKATRLQEAVEVSEYFYDNTIAPRIAYQRHGAEYLDTTSQPG